MSGWIGNLDELGHEPGVKSACVVFVRSFMHVYIYIHIILTLNLCIWMLCLVYLFDVYVVLWLVGWLDT